jgi:hypothetical protein
MQIILNDNGMNLVIVIANRYVTISISQHHTNAAVSADSGVHSEAVAGATLMPSMHQSVFVVRPG